MESFEAKQGPRPSSEDAARYLSGNGQRNDETGLHFMGFLISESEVSSNAAARNGLSDVEPLPLQDEQSVEAKPEKNVPAPHIEETLARTAEDNHEGRQQERKSERRQLRDQPPAPQASPSVVKRRVEKVIIRVGKLAGKTGIVGSSGHGWYQIRSCGLVVQLRRHEFERVEGTGIQLSSSRINTEETESESSEESAQEEEQETERYLDSSPQLCTQPANNQYYRQKQSRVTPQTGTWRKQQNQPSRKRQKLDEKRRQRLDSAQHPVGVEYMPGDELLERSDHGSSGYLGVSFSGKYTNGVTNRRPWRAVAGKARPDPKECYGHFRTPIEAARARRDALARLSSGEEAGHERPPKINPAKEQEECDTAGDELLQRDDDEISGYIGVRYDPDAESKPWTVVVRGVFRGRFETPIEAARARALLAADIKDQTTAQGVGADKLLPGAHSLQRSSCNIEEREERDQEGDAIDLSLFRRDNSSGYQGVYRGAEGSKFPYRAEIRTPARHRLAGSIIFLGNYTDLEEAARAYARSYIQLHGGPPPSKSRKAAPVKEALLRQKAARQKEEAEAKMAAYEEVSDIESVDGEEVDLKPFRVQSATGFRGVYNFKNRYQANIKVGKQDRRHLGTFDTIKEAATCYAKAYIHLFGQPPEAPS